MAKGSNNLEGWISVLTCRKYESSFLMYSALLLQLGYLGNTKLNKSDTVSLFFFFKLIGPDMHPARVDNRDALFIVKA